MTTSTLLPPAPLPTTPLPPTDQGRRHRDHHPHRAFVRDTLVHDAFAHDGLGASSRRWLALMFTDIVGSTPLLVELGDEQWLAVLQWHNTVLRSSFSKHDGRVVNHAGDGFFAVFECPLDALNCAVHIQNELAEGRDRNGFGLHVRIGIQWVDVLEVNGDCVGRGVHEAARINELAGPDEILAGADAVDAAGGGFGVSAIGPVTLRGLPTPTPLMSVSAGLSCAPLARL
jgi:class 3 adenylate cyclase